MKTALVRQIRISTDSMQPIERMQTFYDILQIMHYPFRKKKSVVHKLKLKNNKTHTTGESPPTKLQNGLKSNLHYDLVHQSQN